jgi:hypothetical protein
VAQGLKKVIEDLSAYYLLARYYSTNDKLDGRFRKIEVKLKQPGLTVHARAAYVARPAIAVVAGPAAGARASSAPPAGLTEALSVLAKVRPEADLYAWGGLLPQSDCVSSSSSRAGTSKQPRGAVAASSRLKCARTSGEAHYVRQGDVLRPGRGPLRSPSL